MKDEQILIQIKTTKWASNRKWSSKEQSDTAWVVLQRCSTGLLDVGVGIN